MKKLFHIVVYFPAFIGWFIFVPAWLFANWLIPNDGKYSRWFWANVEAINHNTAYDVYEDL